jgi:adenylate cyclase
MPKLLVYQGDEVVREVAIERSPFAIGRALESDLAVMDHLVSRRHARIYRSEDGAWRIEDLGSSNGIYVNEQRVAEAALADGDRLRIGSAHLCFRADPPPAAAMKVSRSHRTQPGALAVTLAGPNEPDSSLAVAKSVDDLRPEYGGTAQGTPAAGLVALFRERRKQAPGGPPSASHLRDGREGLHFFILYQLAQAVNSATSLEDLFDRALDMLCEALDAGRGAILTIEEAGELVIRATRERRGAARHGRELRIPQTIVRRVIDEKVAILARDALADDRFKEGKSVAAMQVRSAISVPIWDGDHVDGLIYLDASHAINVFSEDDRDLVTAVGHQLAVAMKREEMTRRLKAEAVVRSNLERYHSPDVVEMILRQQGEVGLEVKEAEVSVLFADIEGFTKMSERMAPAEVARILNGYFEGATAAIFRHRGQVNKYIGDAILAVFGAPIPNPDHAAGAVAAALEMIESLREFRKALPPADQFRLRIGINAGPVVAGNIGAARRLEYTVIGSTVNIASRLEKIAPPDGIAIGPEVERRIRGRFAVRSMGGVRLKGLEQDVEVFCLGGEGRPDASPAGLAPSAPSG